MASHAETAGWRGEQSTRWKAAHRRTASAPAATVRRGASLWAALEQPGVVLATPLVNLGCSGSPAARRGGRRRRGRAGRLTPGWLSHWDLSGLQDLVVKDERWPHRATKAPNPVISAPHCEALGQYM